MFMRLESKSRVHIIKYMQIKFGGKVTKSFFICKLCGTNL